MASTVTFNILTVKSICLWHTIKSHTTGISFLDTILKYVQIWRYAKNSSSSSAWNITMFSGLKRHSWCGQFFPWDIEFISNLCNYHQNYLCNYITTYGLWVLKITHEYNFSYLDQVCIDMLLQITTLVIHAKTCVGINGLDISTPTPWPGPNLVLLLRCKASIFDQAKSLPDQNVLFSCSWYLIKMLSVGDELMCKNDLLVWCLVMLGSQDSRYCKLRNWHPKQ